MIAGPSTGEFNATIPIKYGNNPVSITVINGKEKYEMGRILYHDKMSIELDIKGLNKNEKRCNNYGQRYYRNKG